MRTRYICPASLSRAPVQKTIPKNGAAYHAAAGAAAYTGSMLSMFPASHGLWGQHHDGRHRAWVSHLTPEMVTAMIYRG